jgi:UDP-N-acetylglucosamine:LPS N-acetylglucosamine transferase
MQERLYPLIADLLHSPDKRETMRASMRALSRPGAADAIASQLLELAGETPL